MMNLDADRAAFAAEAQAIVDEFAEFDDWTDRYQYLIDLGRKLPALPDAERTDEVKVNGCSSQVWLICKPDGERLSFAAASDSTIVSGLIALLLRVYSGRLAQTIVSSEPQFVEQIGLKRHLSPTRANGLASMIQTLRRHATMALRAD